MQVVITILLCFIIALGLFIVYAGLGGGHRDHRHYYGGYDLDTLYRDRLFSWWNYPPRNDYYHHGNHHGMGHTQNHGTQIVFSQPPIHHQPPVHHTSSPPLPSKNVEFPLYSAHTSSTSSSSKPNVEGATTMAESQAMNRPSNLRMTIPTSSTSTMPSSLPQTRLNIPANTQTAGQGASLVNNARQMVQRSRVSTTTETSSQPTTTLPATMVSTPTVNASATENVNTNTITPSSEGFQPNSYNLSCGSYNCAEP